MNANIGMLHPVAAVVDSYTPGTGITYENGFVVAEARSAGLSWEREDGRFYGDDVELDSANGVLGYSLEFEPSGLKDGVRESLLGESKASSEYTITDAVAPDVGFGYVRVMRSEGSSGKVETTYEGWWFYKLKFGVTREETQTKERSIEWRVPTLTGNGAGVKLDNTNVLSFAVHQTFTTAAAAIAYIEEKANFATTPATT